MQNCLSLSCSFCSVPLTCDISLFINNVSIFQTLYLIDKHYLMNRPYNIIMFKKNNNTFKKILKSSSTMDTEREKHTLNTPTNKNCQEDQKTLTRSLRTLHIILQHRCFISEVHLTEQHHNRVWCERDSHAAVCSSSISPNISFISLQSSF